MSEDAKLNKARKIYQQLIDTLDENDLKYDKYDEDLEVQLVFTGDDLPITLRISVNPDVQLVELLSQLPFNFPEDKRVEGAIATSATNYLFRDGSFDYSLSNGATIFRLTTSFKGETVLDPEVFIYMITIANNTVDEYNDKFFMVSKGMLTVAKFIEEINQ